jgi:hypothetical protein
MERWAANTLRTLGIILTAGFVIVTCLFLALLSMCAAQPGMGGGSGNPQQAAGFAIAAVLVAILGIAFIAWLARGIVRSQAAAEPSEASSGSTFPTAPQSSVPFHLSPSGRQAVNRLAFALATQIVVSSIAWFWNQYHFWTTPHSLPPHRWTLLLLIPFLLYHVPYALLIYFLVKQPDRRTFACALAVPAILVLQALFSLSVLSMAYIHHPAGLALAYVPWLIHIVIIVLAYKAIQQTAIHPEPSSLIVVALAAFFYFSFIHVATPLLYRFAWK